MKRHDLSTKRKPPLFAGASNNDQVFTQTIIKILSVNFFPNRKEGRLAWLPVAKSIPHFLKPQNQLLRCESRTITESGKSSIDEKAF